MLNFEAAFILGWIVREGSQKPQEVRDRPYMTSDGKGEVGVKPNLIL